MSEMNIAATINVHNDEMTGPNAFAQKSNNLAEDGEVLLGRRFIRERILEGRGSDISILAVIAHEMAHILQLKRGICDALICGGGVRDVELHADFLAGFCLGRMNVSFDTGRAVELTNAWARLGDKFFGNCNHHGTADQRLSCLLAGFNLSQSGDSFETSIIAGREHVLNFGRCGITCGN
ncbi:neutral zinc metallopeptidase [Microvirga sesbaniae]|uniref:neutral zinc metallopeptidase n=1 Tax=Microvirga sesbaniae TaxID=681392 RepID=UPI0021C9C4CD|nr:neutral zinc metallopeptidase [Microvirga sp. HBU67692]